MAWTRAIETPRPASRRPSERMKRSFRDSGLAASEASRLHLDSTPRPTTWSLNLNEPGLGGSVLPPRLEIDIEVRGTGGRIRARRSQDPALRHFGGNIEETVESVFGLDVTLEGAGTGARDSRLASESRQPLPVAQHQVGRQLGADSKDNVPGAAQ